MTWSQGGRQCGVAASQAGPWYWPPLSLPAGCAGWGATQTGCTAPAHISQLMTQQRHSWLLHDLQDSRTRLICSRSAGPIVCTPSGDQMSLLYGLQKQGEAYLLRTLRVCGHRYRSINQSINADSADEALPAESDIELQVLGSSFSRRRLYSTCTLQ